MAHIRKRDLLNVFFRSFFIQASWNYERMIALGFCFCLLPIARRLFKNDQKRISFLKRHLVFFNSHPYLVTYALGAVANIEQQAVLKQWDDYRSIDIFKRRVVGPLGSIGDMLFWQLMLPACGALGVVFLFLIKPWGALAFLLIYNTVHIFVRARGLIKSYLKGFDIVRDLSLRGTKKYLQTLTYFFSTLLGVEIVYVAMKVLHFEHAWKGLMVFILSLIISYFAIRRKKIQIDLLIAIVICGTFLIGLVI